jgi:hypothetical protein
MNMEWDGTLWIPDGSPSIVHENNGDSAWVMIRKADKWCDRCGVMEYDYDTVEFARQDGQTVEQFKADFPEGEPVASHLQIGKLDLPDEVS